MTPDHFVMVVVIALARFHGPTGQRIDVNPAEVTSVREVQKGGLLAEGVKCLLGMSNGKFISLGDDCETARQALRGAPGQAPCVMVCGEVRKREPGSTR